MAACIFCEIACGRQQASAVFEDDAFIGFLDVRPVFLGHVLVIPKRHVETLADLPNEMIEPLFSRVRRMSAAVPAALGCEGTFVANNNKVSQSVPHLHIHVVPRTKGDGLRGFFWPRTKYESDAQMADYAGRIKAAYGSHT